MTPDKLHDAIMEAQRFLRLAKDAMRFREDAEVPFNPSKQTGAVKRASMDLTRALAAMRRPS
jgi:hypothetical protein